MKRWILGLFTVSVFAFLLSVFNVQEANAGLLKRLFARHGHHSCHHSCHRSKCCKSGSGSGHDHDNHPHSDKPDENLKDPKKGTGEQTVPPDSTNENNAT